MRFAIDTNVIINLIGGTQDVAARAAAALARGAERHGLVVCPVVYAELLAHPRWGREEIDAFLRSTAIAVDWELPPSLWGNVGGTWAGYSSRRRRQPGGAPRRLLADFVVGAHAVLAGGLVTADADFYKTNFPDLRIVEI